MATNKQLDFGHSLYLARGYCDNAKRYAEGTYERGINPPQMDAAISSVGMALEAIARGLEKVNAVSDKESQLVRALGRKLGAHHGALYYPWKK